MDNTTNITLHMPLLPTYSWCDRRYIPPTIDNFFLGLVAWTTPSIFNVWQLYSPSSTKEIFPMKSNSSKDCILLECVVIWTSSLNQRTVNWLVSKREISWQVNTTVPFKDALWSLIVNEGTSERKNYRRKYIMWERGICVTYYQIIESL